MTDTNPKAGSAAHGAAEPARIGYQGEPGAYSEEATLVMFPDAELRGHRTFRHAFDALDTGSIDIAVLPVENTLGGIVQEVNDGLWETGGLRITAQYVHPIVHCLIGRRGDTITRARSHPQALSQCRHWLHEHDIDAVQADDTAGSVRWLAETPTPGMAAIASSAAARRYGLDVLAEGIQDDDSNRTRFLVVDRGTPTRPGAGTEGDRCSLAFVTAHRPGSLFAAMRCFQPVNLTRLDSRPSAGRPFEYRFYLDFEVADPTLAEACLTELEREAMEVRLFGTFPTVSG
jgi:prephenate dehydratase